jgi:hypothetical protein
MSKLIEVDKIEWQKGVFVNPNTEEPLPIIHKIATIEMLRDFQEEVKAISLDEVKKAREEIEQLKPNNPNYKWYKGETIAINKVLEILDKLIAESEE